MENILTDNGREYCGRLMINPYQIFLELNDIERRRTILDEFLRETFREKLYTSVEELQEDLDKWLDHYNYERPHRVYRNAGRCPIETIESGKNVKEQVTKEAA